MPIKRTVNTLRINIAASTLTISIKNKYTINSIKQAKNKYKINFIKQAKKHIKSKLSSRLKKYTNNVIKRKLKTIIQSPLTNKQAEKINNQYATTINDQLGRKQLCHQNFSETLFFHFSINKIAFRLFYTYTLLYTYNKDIMDGHSYNID